MDKKNNVSQTRHPQSSRKLPANVASLEPIPAQLLQAQASAGQGSAIQGSAVQGSAVQGNVGEERVDRVVFDETPNLSPTLPEIAKAPEVRVAKGRVMMLGLRGIPHLQGGIEKHVEMLSQELVARGWDVDVLGRSRYLPEKSVATWRGIRIVPLWAPKSILFEAIIHTLFGVLYAALRRPDILHIHAIGPGLLAPIARLLGLKVVLTHHGFDYDREKWSPSSKRILRFGERLSMMFANGRIAVSRDVAETMKRRYNSDVVHVPNGVEVRRSPVASQATLERFGLQPRRYIIMVARFVPEKRQTDLIAAFAKLAPPDWKLVLVGGPDHQRVNYAKEIETAAARSPNVVLTGFQSGEDLAALFSQAGLFVLPSMHEGMPISLLEAMSYGLPVLASDIVANHEVSLPPEDYFPVGDVEALTQALARKIAEPFGQEVAQSRIRDIERMYAWSTITRDTLAVYNAVTGKNEAGKGDTGKGEAKEQR